MMDFHRTNSAINDMNRVLLKFYYCEGISDSQIVRIPAFLRQFVRYRSIHQSSSDGSSSCTCPLKAYVSFLLATLSMWLALFLISSCVGSLQAFFLEITWHKSEKWCLGPQNAQWPRLNDTSFEALSTPMVHGPCSETQFASTNS